MRNVKKIEVCMCEEGDLHTLTDDLQKYTEVIKFEISPLCIIGFIIYVKMSVTELMFS